MTTREQAMALNSVLGFASRRLPSHSLSGEAFLNYCVWKQQWWFEINKARIALTTVPHDAADTGGQHGLCSSDSEATPQTGCERVSTRAPDAQTAVSDPDAGGVSTP